MTPDRKKSVLGVLVDPIQAPEVVREVDRAARSGQRCTVSALAVHGVMTGVFDPEHRYRLNHLDLVVPDGQPVRWGLNLLHRAGLRDRVYGPDLMLAVCAQCAESAHPVYLYGSRPEVLQRLGESLSERFPGLEIVGAEPSAFRRLSAGENDSVLARIRSSGARVVFVGLGCPRQEVWAFENGDALSTPIIAVGAAFDFHAGLLPQAPPILQRWGLEWLYRLAQEPRRLWRRYLLLNPAYLVLLALQSLRLRDPDPASAKMPASEILYG